MNRRKMHYHHTYVRQTLFQDKSKMNKNKAEQKFKTRGKQISS
jgi:hypothetical protein